MSVAANCLLVSFLNQLVVSFATSSAHLMSLMVLQILFLSAILVINHLSSWLYAHWYFAFLPFAPEKEVVKVVNTFESWEPQLIKTPKQWGPFSISSELIDYWSTWLAWTLNWVRPLNQHQTLEHWPLNADGTSGPLGPISVCVWISYQ